MPSALYLAKQKRLHALVDMINAQAAVLRELLTSASTDVAEKKANIETLDKELKALKLQAETHQDFPENNSDRIATKQEIERKRTELDAAIRKMVEMDQLVQLEIGPAEKYLLDKKIPFNTKKYPNFSSALTMQDLVIDRITDATKVSFFKSASSYNTMLTTEKNFNLTQEEELALIKSRANLAAALVSAVFLLEMAIMVVGTLTLTAYVSPILGFIFLGLVAAAILAQITQMDKIMRNSVDYFTTVTEDIDLGKDASELFPELDNLETQYSTYTPM